MRSERRRSALPAAVAALLLASTASAEPVDYLREIKPILKARCYACHGALKQESGLRLDAGKLIRAGGEGGSVVVPSQAAESALFKRIAATDPAVRMPPEGEPLKPEQIERIRNWISEGAVSPAEEQPEADPQAHWAFQIPVRPPQPEVRRGDLARNPIDAFLSHELDQRGLTAQPEAEKHLLLRRVFFDLIGLPPTRDELHAFLADESPDAYAAVVDRLLNDPRYGERWGRHWMDVWRYSDWYGRRAVPDVMNSYPRIWRWRDWIVRSLNADKGYDGMVREMLAADEVTPENLDNVVATGFITRNWFKWNYDTWMRDQVEHTGKAFLGLWFQCSLCHDHKYDPISQHEYFQLRAFFEPLELRHDRLPGEPDPGPFQKYVYGKAYGPIGSGLVRVFDEKLTAETRVYRGGDQRNLVKELPPMLPAVPRFLGGDSLRIVPVPLPVTSWYPGLRPSVQQEEFAKRQSQCAAAEHAVAAARSAPQRQSAGSPSTASPSTASPSADLMIKVAEAKLAAAQFELDSVHSRIAAETARYITHAPEAATLARTAAIVERRALHQAAVVTELAAELALATAEALPPATPKRTETVQQAGHALETARKARAKAEATLTLTDAVYSALGPIYPQQSTGRRTALANWIVDRQNPLAARVAVNHIWNWHFGRPLVETVSNFGRNGKPPSHPKLLDWLAVEFMEHGWSQKHLHRVITTSRAYRQASHAPADHPGSQRDPENRTLWRANRQRLEAELVRDSVLYVAGQLDMTLGGPELDQSLGLTSHRRSLYFSHHGEARMPFLELFDAPSTVDCYQRTTSVLPQQALALANSELTRQQAAHLAAALAEGLEATAREAEAARWFVTAAFEQVLTRAPTGAEVAASLAFLERQRLLYVAAARSAENTSRTIDPLARSREGLVHALLNQNDFLTIR